MSEQEEPFHLTETPDMADWLKIPSEVAISAGHPEWGPLDVMKYLEEQGQTETLLYRRLQEDPYFEEKLRAKGKP